MNQTLPRVCVIGAGSSGIAACRNFKAYGLPHVCYEAADRIGGMWAFKNNIAYNGKSSAYRSLHINTSPRQMAFRDFPMPADYPDFPGHAEVAAYFESFVDHFDLRDAIRLGTAVTHCERQATGGWQVRLSDGGIEHFDALVVANGHHWDPRWPNPPLPGHFDGVQMHAHDYVDPGEPHDLRGKRVVVLGMGNSAMDIASELAHKENAEKVFLSVRTGTYVLPKYFFGKLVYDSLLRHPSSPPGLLERLVWSLPDVVFDKLLYPLATLGLNILVGSPERYGLPRPKGWFGQQHPTISSEVHIRLGSGDILPRPTITELQGDRVRFADGSVEPVDAILYATGYNIRFPFLDEHLISAPDNDIALYQRMMDPRYPDLLFLGLVQPFCAMMPIADEQSRWMAEYLTGQYHPPAPSEMHRRMQAEHARTKRRFVASPRHTIQINCQEYTYHLGRDLAEGRRRARTAANALPVPHQPPGADDALAGHTGSVAEPALCC